jgi:hypothetical protein
MKKKCGSKPAHLKLDDFLVAVLRACLIDNVSSFYNPRRFTKIKINMIDETTR